MSPMPSQPPGAGRRRRLQLHGRHVREQEVLEADLVNRPRRVDYRATRPHEQRQLAPAVTRADDLLDTADLAERPARTRQEPVAREQFLDRAFELDGPLAEQRDPLAHTLDVRD